MFPDECNERRLLKLDTAFVFLGNRNVLNEITDVLNTGLTWYDLFVIDKYNNLYTETVYDKYGGSMKLS